jgi:hypothetical protein
MRNETKTAIPGSDETYLDFGNLDTGRITLKVWLKEI